MPLVYILKSLKYPKTYVGSTVDLEKRLGEHNKGSSDFSSKFRPWKLAYKEEYENIKIARLREKYFKSAAGRRFIKKGKLVN